MASQTLVLAAIVCAASARVISSGLPLNAQISAGPLAVSTPLLRTVAVDSEYDPNPQYSYAYDVEDALTGDSKSQHESRQGDVVQGSYSLNDPDGTRRIVDYAADPINGFNAVVRREPLRQQARIALTSSVARVGSPLTIASDVRPRLSIASPIGSTLAIASPLSSRVAITSSPLAGIGSTVAFASPLSSASRLVSTLGHTSQVVALGPRGIAIGPQDIRFAPQAIALGPGTIYG